MTNNSPLPEPPDARELTRRLLARGSATSSTTPADVAAANLAAVEGVYLALSRWLGATGCRALFTRALTQTRLPHPPLLAIRLGAAPSEPLVDGLAAAVQAHGGAAMAAGLEAWLEALIELLTRLVGEDLAARLVDHGDPTHALDDQDAT